MSHADDARATDFELLRRLGGKWAVLTAMSLTISKAGSPVPSDVHDKLKIARIKISSGCFSPCEASCALAEVEGRLFAQGHVLGDQQFMMWSDLLGDAMQGKLDYERILRTPALEPVKNDCRFLGCTCSQV